MTPDDTGNPAQSRGKLFRVQTNLMDLFTLPPPHTRCNWESPLEPVLLLRPHPRAHRGDLLALQPALPQTCCVRRCVSRIVGVSVLHGARGAVQIPPGTGNTAHDYSDILFGDIPMRAIVITSTGNPDVLQVQQVPDPPSPAPGQVLVEVSAMGVNRADTLQRQGKYPAPPGYPAHIPGLEFAGTVLEVGPDVAQWAVGSRVMGITGGGAYVERLCMPADQLLPVPAHLTLEQAAGFAEAQLTAFDALRLQAHLRAGQTLLIHAIGSGVGIAALQQARALGVTAIGTARSSWKLARAQLLGLPHPILVEDGQFLEAIQALTAGQGVDVVLDFMGASYFLQNLRALRTEGIMVHLALMGGARTEIPLDMVMMKRLTVRGSTLRARPAPEKAALVQAFRQELGEALELGTLDPVIDQIYPAQQAAEAHRVMEANQNFGKLVLRWE